MTAGCITQTHPHTYTHTHVLPGGALLFERWLCIAYFIVDHKYIYTYIQYKILDLRLQKNRYWCMYTHVRQRGWGCPLTERGGMSQRGEGCPLDQYKFCTITIFPGSFWVAGFRPSIPSFVGFRPSIPSLNTGFRPSIPSFVWFVTCTLFQVVPLTVSQGPYALVSGEWGRHPLKFQLAFCEMPLGFSRVYVSGNIS